MKKALSLIVCLAMVMSVFGVIALAADPEYTVDPESGNASVAEPYGYTWKIDSFGGAMAGEDVRIFTSNDAYASGNPNWAITLFLEKKAENVYVAVKDAIVTPGSAANAGIDITDGKIALVVHSASSNPNDAETYPNWFGKVCAMAVKTGDYITFTGVDFANETLAEGASATVVKELPADKPADGPYNVSEGKKYTVSEGAGKYDHDNLTDTAEDGSTRGKWTDGVVTNDGGAADNGAWLGIANSETGKWDLDIIVDLEKVENVKTVSMALYGGAWGITAPDGTTMKVAVSTDGTNYTDAGVATETVVDASGWGRSNQVLELASAVSARFVKLSVSVNSQYVWSDEIVIMAVPAAASSTGKVLGDNIAAGKTYVANGFIEGSYPDDGGEMTDGKFAASAGYGEPEYIGLNVGSPEYENGGAWINVDLGEVKNVGKVGISASNLCSAGINGPKGFTVVFSNDGETWTEAQNLAYEAELVAGEKAYASITLDVNARFVKVVIDPGSNWMFIDEVEVYELKAGSGSAPVKETITVDGVLDDNGWAEDKWISVDKTNGTFQGGEASMLNASSLNFSYKFQMRTDDTKLYVAAVFDLADAAEVNGDTKFRLWLNTDSEATVYTHFYDITSAGVASKYNTSKTENKGAVIENSTAVGKMVVDGQKVTYEFSVDLAEFGGENGFNYFFNAGHNNTVDGVKDNIQMLYPTIEIPEDNVNGNQPYKVWSVDDAAHLDPADPDVMLGEIGGNMGDTGIYAIAALAVVALIGTAVVIKKRA